MSPEEVLLLQAGLDLFRSHEHPEDSGSDYSPDDMAYATTPTPDDSEYDLEPTTPSLPDPSDTGLYVDAFLAATCPSTDNPEPPLIDTDICPPELLPTDDCERTCIPIPPNQPEVGPIVNLDPHWVDSPEIAEMAELLYNDVKLRALQAEHRKLTEADPKRAEELTRDITTIRSTMCTHDMADLRPEQFPLDLWRYVTDEQKFQVAARFALFPDDVRTELIDEILTKLDIEKAGTKSQLEPFMRAQALANLDVFGYPDPHNPYTVPGYTFRLTTTHDRPIFCPAGKYNQTESAFLDARLYYLMNHNKIEPSTAIHNCPLVLVPYSDKIKASLTKWGADAVTEMFKPCNYEEVAQWYRLTNNLKAVNDVTEPYRHPMPDQTDPIHFTLGSRYWSSTDIKDAFFCINMHPDDRDKTTFTTPRGRFRFQVMPQGAKNSPTFFAQVAQDTFSHIPKSELINFIDDTLNHSRTFDQHLVTQQRMYDALRSKRLIMKVSKSHFLYDSMRVLGNIYSEHGRVPDPKLVKALTDIATPTDVTGIRSFLGLLNFNQDYIPNYKSIIAPLEACLCKDVDIADVWKDEIHGVAFREAKRALTSAPCLMAIDVTKPFTIHVDACKNGRGPGAVLLQHNGKHWRPVAYFSCKLRKGETAWSATELEAMALVYAIRHWSPYLKVQKFTCVVDHHALIWLVTRPPKTANGRILHWISDLAEYHFDIIHRSGKEHLDADAVSRLLCHTDLPERYPDASDLVDAITGPVTTKDLQEAYMRFVDMEAYMRRLYPQGQPSDLTNPESYQPAVDTIELGVNTLGIASPLPEVSQPILRRYNVPGVGPRPVGRPSKKTTNPPQPAGLPHSDKKSRYDVTHPRATKYQHLLHQIYIDPTNHRVYRVVLVWFHGTHGPVVSRACCDDDPPDPTDSQPWAIEGDMGVEALVKQYLESGTTISPVIQPTPWPRSEPDMLQLQRQDPALGPVIDRLLAYPNEYYIHDVRTFFYLSEQSNGECGALRVRHLGPPSKAWTNFPLPRDTDVVVLPIHLRHQLLQFYHDQTGHPGSHRTKETIKLRYWWPGMTTDVHDYVNTCNWCQMRKVDQHPGTLPIMAYPAPHHPFEIIHIDLTGEGLPCTKRGMRYIFVIKCPLTRATEIYALPDKSAFTVAKCIVDNIYCRHGAPHTIMSDQGNEFVNEVMEQIGILLVINRIRTTGGNPRSNGLAENHNKVLKDMLSSYTNAYQDDWDLYLPIINHAYMTTVNTQTGYTPFFMLYGREARQPDEEWIDKFMADTIKPDSYVRRLAQVLRFCWDHAANSKVKEVEIMNRKPTGSLPFKEFEVGSRFYLRRAALPEALTPADMAIPKAQRKKHTISPSLQHRWTGPHEVIEKLSPVLYVGIVNKVRRTVHAFNMKHDAGESALRVRNPITPQPYTTALNVHQRVHYAHRLPTATIATQTDAEDTQP
jgi:hypothetical protein